MEPDTRTSTEQRAVESNILSFYETFLTINQTFDELKLNREAHIQYLQKALRGLGGGWASLDASKPWLCYWITHSLELLDAPFSPELTTNLINYLNKCQNPNGGFGGGPGQLPHLAPTFAAVSTLMLLNDDRAYKIINREKMKSFLLSLKLPNGAFMMHDQGESDTRSCYCAMVVASYLNILTPDLIEGTGEWLATCQTYEGGIGGEPGVEAHAGLAFCGLAALMIINKAHLIDLNRFIKWAVSRQMTSEGGFQGRANKVVDACYSYWGGGLFPLIDRLLQMKTQSPNTNANITNNSNVEVHSPTQTDLIGDEEGAKKTKRNLRTSAISMKSLRDSMKSGMSITEISESGEALDEVTRMNSVEMRDWNPNESGVVSESMDEDEEIDEISIAENLINMKHRSESFDQRPAGWLFNQKMLQQYLLTCAQEKNGGLRDKPGKSPDYYHTCYALSGISVAQHNALGLPPSVVGKSSNLLRPTDPLYNIGPEKLIRAFEYFSQLETL
jgi:protein farnesyltransferase subunit beta